MRASELIGATPGHVETDPRGDYWLRVTGKGKKRGSVALPPLARDALARYLVERDLPVLPVRWNPQTPVIGSLEADSDAAISSVRLWMVMRRFFLLAAMAIESDHAPLAEKLRRASPHWMRHTHALGRGAEDGRVIDGGRSGNGARWLNHACAANCEAVEEAGRIYIQAIGSIAPGEELFIDYALDVPLEALHESAGEYACRCGTKRCRGTMLNVS